MKKILVIVASINFGLFGQSETTTNNGWDSSISYGILSEKTPISIIEYSSLFNINKNSEFYATVGTALFGSGVGLGYKYYFKTKSTSSIFISFGSQFAHLGTVQEGMTIYGLSVSSGYSIIRKGVSPVKGIVPAYREKNGGEFKAVKLKKDSLNIGVSFMYLGDHSFGFLPYIYIERRF